MKPETTKSILVTTVVVAALVAGFWVARDITTAARKAKNDIAAAPRPFRQFDPPNPSAAKSQPRHASKRPVNLEDLLLGVPGERLVRFDNDAAYRAFLARLARSDARLLGHLDRFRTARVGYDDLSDLEALLDDDAEDFGNYYVSIPNLPQVDAQPGALGFGRATLEWLGVTRDNSTWGEGVRIAMLDTGIGQHSAFPETIREIDLITGDGPPIDLHGHGTAVASLLIGSDDVSQGIAPAASLLSIRIGDETGSSNSFLLAEGIVRAVDEGAQVINISMGSYGNSGLVKEAVDYALESNVVIVAAAGNEGLDRPAFPAAYDGVIAVGAVDGNGQHLNFSNTGEEIDMGAPGYEIVSAWPGDQFTSFSGTSASAPIVAGAIAATMSEFGPLSPDNAADYVAEYLNAAGAPGDDPQYGEGIIDLGRVMNSETPGILDGAIASNWYEAPAEDGGVGNLLVTIENRGTELLRNAQVEINVAGSVYPMVVSSLQPGDTRVLTLPVNAPTNLQSVPVRSDLTIPGVEDIKPQNNSLRGDIILVAPQDPEATAHTNAPGPGSPLPDEEPGTAPPREGSRGTSPAPQ